MARYVKTADFCRACLMPIVKHPYPQCPYVYRLIRHEGRVIGYDLKDKPRKRA